MSPKGFLSGSSVVLERAVQERRGSHQEAVNPLRGWWSPSSGGRGGGGEDGRVEGGMDGWCGEPQLSGGGMELSGPRKSGRALSGKTTEVCWKRSWTRSSGV